MALTGTLKDLGIAEILQLLGQQAKTGVLHVRRKDDEVHVTLSEGFVVSAEDARRSRRDRLGAMLVRAELIGPSDLERALDEQRRTLRRLGDILADAHLVSRQDLKEMAALQTSETMFRLFSWKAGRYRFEPGPVEWDASTVTPIRAEAVLMEGFRQLDEWPMVRRKITSPETTFVRSGELPSAAAPAAPGERDEASFDDLGEDDAGGGHSAVGTAERKVFALAEPGRTVERIVDLSRLGEFATWKALVTLLNLGLLQAVPPQKRSPAAEVTAYARSWQDRLRRRLAGASATLALGALLALAAWLAAERAVAGTGGAPASLDQVGRRLVARAQLARLDSAVELWRLEHGEYPQHLHQLVETGLATPRDLRYPYAEHYHYRRRAEGGFVLLPPLP